MKLYYEVTIEVNDPIITTDAVETLIRRAIREYIEDDSTFLVDVELTDTEESS
jgi:hypothetical protein